MTGLLLVLLAALWGAVFVPAILRARRVTSPIASVGTFRRGMSALSGRMSPSSGRWVLVPSKPQDLEEARRREVDRKRRIFGALIVSSVVTFAAGLVPGMHGLLKLNVALDLTLALYVILLLQLKGRRSEQPELEVEEETFYAKAGQF